MMPDRNPILSYGAEQRLRAVLASAAETDGLQTPARVEAALIGELRRRKRWMLAGRLTAAGALAAAVLIGLFLTRSTPSIPSPPPIAAKAPREVLAPAPAPPPAPVVMKVPHRRVRKPIEQQRIADTRPNEFIPVGAWQALEPMERGSIVRVRLPKSSLPGLGIPVSADRWNESIPADVVLGEDGTMRAVRFVKTSQ
jgi:hypothetical protein